MSKKKKNKSKNDFNDVVAPFLNDNKMLWTFIGGAAVGVGLAAIFGTEKGQEIVDKVSQAAKGILPDEKGGGNEGGSENGGKKSSSAKKPTI